MKKGLIYRENFHQKRGGKITYEISYKVRDVVSGVCGICGVSTYEDPTNIILDDKIFHFDCVVNKIREQFGVSEDKKIIYLGSNSFGIFWESKNNKKLELLKKVNVSDVIG